MSKAERRWRTEKKVVSRFWYLKRIYRNTEIPERKIGRCRKHHPYDCGKAGCFGCHSDKILKEPTRQQIWSDLYLKEEF